MNNAHTNLREFGKCRLDVEKKFLWHEQKPVQLPLKAVELLCVLVENGGEVVTKNEIWQTVWQNAFVEETNLTHNIYLLRKTFKDLGEQNLIKTVPRRGYRFAGEVRETKNGDGQLITERHAVSRNLVEEILGETEFSPQRHRGTERLKEKKKNSLQRISFSPLLLFSLCSILLVALLTGFAFWRNNKTANVSNIKSIAVLPFKTIDGEKGNEHQGLGLADVLITRLSNLKEINVRPTSAILNFDNQDAIAFGKKLNVDAVLEGAIYRTNERVRVTARLIKTSDNAPVWAGQFEKSLQDELRLQDEIALQVVDALALNLSGDEKNALTKRYTENADAYQLYLKGRYEWNKRSWQGMIDAQRLFRNAIERDPNFAPAYVGLADMMATTGDSNESYIAVQKALELDPNLAEAHASLGFIQMFHEWKWQEAETSFKKSIELNPNYATAHHWYAELLAIEGRNAEAKSEMRRALEINPLSYNFLADLGQIYYFNREYKEAEDYCRKALEIYPEFVFAHQYLGNIYLKTGEFEKAVEEEIKAQKINSTFANDSAKRKKAIEAGFELQSKIYREGDIAKFVKNLIGETQSPSNLYLYATRYAFLGEKEKALDCLEKAYEGRGFLAAFIKADPIFDGLREEPLYQEILRKMNLQ